MTTRIFGLGALVALFGLQTGCVTGRVLRSVNENGDRNVTLVRTSDHYTIVPLFFGKTVDQFWACSQTDKTITCHKACDGKTDLVCPGDAGGDNSAQSNIK